jgi:hypothetical protein
MGIIRGRIVGVDQAVTHRFSSALVGRAAELDALLALHSEAREGHARVALLCG